MCLLSYKVLSGLVRLIWSVSWYPELNPESKCSWALVWFLFKEFTESQACIDRLRQPWSALRQTGALNMPANLENSAVATGLEKCQFSFQSQRKTMPKNLQITAQLHSLCPQIWKTQQWPQDWKNVSFHSNSKEKQCQRMLKLLHNCTHLTR